MNKSVQMMREHRRINRRVEVDGTVAGIFDGWLRERGAVLQENFRLWGAITHLTTEAGGSRPIRL
jgi:hypothetical protein